MTLVDTGPAPEYKSIGGSNSHDRGAYRIMEILFVIVPVFIVVVFVIILVSWARQVAEWADNNAKPVESVPATVVAKRSEVSGHHSPNQVGSTYTSYYCTFEFADGERREFGVSGQEYGMLVEGDAGTLTCQGTRYHGFQRSRG